MVSEQPTLVIARHNEDVSWSDDYPRVIIQKGVDLPNIGREISSYFYFIVTNYQQLKGEYIFCQGHPFDHAPNFLKELCEENYYGKDHNCDPMGHPHHPNLDMHKLCKTLQLPIKNQYQFKAGAQFKLTAQQIHQRPWEWYVKALNQSLKGNNPWIFERLITDIWQIES